MSLTSSRFVACLIGTALAVSAYAQVSNFDTLNGYATAIESQVTQSRLNVLRQSSSEAASNLSVAANYVTRNVDAAKDSIERESRSENFLVGYTWKQSDWNIGVGIGYDYTRADYTEVRSPAPIPLHGRVHAETTSFAAWGGVDAGWVQLSFNGSLGSTDNNAKRVSDAGSSKGDYKGKQSAFSVRLSHRMPFESVVFDPFIGLSFASADVDGFTEQGVAPDRRVLRDFSLKDNRFIFGFRVAGKDGDWVPSASAAFLTRMSGGDSSISNTAINGSNLGVGVIPEASNGLLYLNLAINGKIDEHWTLGGLIDYTTGGDEHQLGLNVRLSRSF